MTDVGTRSYFSNAGIEKSYKQILDKLREK